MRKSQMRFFKEEFATAKKEFKKFVAIEKAFIYFIVESPSLRRIELSARIENYFKL